MNVLIVGDSFSTIWPNTTGSWPELLSNSHTVTNLSCAGVSEYKILKQLESTYIPAYDLVIVSHTSESRVHTRQHPIHTLGLHKDCDLIITDLTPKFSWFNPSLKTAINWFKYHYDAEYQKTIYGLIRSKISNMIAVQSIHIDHFPDSVPTAPEINHLDFSKFWPTERGNINHYTRTGNAFIFSEVSKTIDLLFKKSV
jgi:hypothetical protein